MNKSKFVIYSFLFSFCSFAYQMLMAKVVILEIGHEVIAFCGTTALFFYGMALGNFRLQMKPLVSPIFGLLKIERALPTVALLSLNLIVFCFSISRWAMQNSDSQAQQVLFNLGMAISFGGSLLLGFFAGQELPLLEKSFATQSNISSFSRLMFLSYLGAFCSGIVILWWLHPILGSFGAVLLIVIFNFLILLTLREGRNTKNFAGVLIALSFFLAGPKIENFYARLSYLEFNQAYVGNFFSSLIDSLADIAQVQVQRTYSKYQTIDLVDRKILSQESQALYLNYNYQFDSRYEKTYHEAMLSALKVLQSNPLQKILLLGAGDGLMAKYLLAQFPEIEKIKIIELDPQILALAQQNPKWKALNENSLQNPKVEVVIADAFTYLKESKEAWDYILIDFPYPTSFDLSRLYSVEFYQFAKARLNETGALVFDFPLREHAPIIRETLISAGLPNMIGLEHGETFVVTSLAHKLDEAKFIAKDFKIIQIPISTTVRANTLDRPTLPRLF